MKLRKPLTKNEITWEAEMLLGKNLINKIEATVMSQKYQMED